MSGRRQYAAAASAKEYARQGCARGFKNCNAGARDCWFQRDACEEATNITFWLDKRGRMIPGELPNDGIVFLVTNIFVASWPWVLGSAASATLWTLLFQFGIATFDVPGVAVGVVLTFLSFWASTVWSGSLGKRDGAGGNLIGMVSATKNLMHAAVSSLNVEKARGNPTYRVTMHNGASYEEVDVPAMALFKYLAVCLNALIAAQRNVLRGGFDPKKLPLYPEMMAEVVAETARGIDVLEVLQTMSLRYFAGLARSGVSDLDDKWVQAFYKDKVDSLGNIDIGGKLPFSRANANYAFLTQLIATIVTPLWFSRVFPGFSAIWISPIVLSFYYGLFAISARQPKIAVSQSDNYWTDVKLTAEMREGAKSNYATAAQAARIVAGKDNLPINGGVAPAVPSSNGTGAGPTAVPTSLPPPAAAANPATVAKDKSLWGDF